MLLLDLSFSINIHMYISFLRIVHYDQSKKRLNSRPSRY